MKDLSSRLLGVVTAAMAGMWLTGCACVEESKPVAKPPPAPAPKAQVVPAAKPAPKPASAGNCQSVRMADGRTTVELAFPTGNPETSVILLEKSAPTEVQVGEAYDATMKVTNLMNCPLVAVVVTDQLPPNYELVASNPQAKLSPDGVAMWELGAMGPRDSKTIILRGANKTAGEIVTCSRVDYRVQLCLPVNVVSPKLQLALSLPTEALLCDNIPARLAVSNTGSGDARNVRVSDPLPTGLTTVDGKSLVEFDVPVLSAGQSKDALFQVIAAKTGSYTNRATAKANGGLSADASASVVVRQPILTIAKRATDRQFAGRNVAYEIIVANKGDATAKDVIIRDRVPTGTTLVTAGEGGVVNKDGLIEWVVGNLAPDAAKKVAFVVRSNQTGRIVNVAEATGVCAAPVKDQAETMIFGVPGILLEMIDVEDPIEVGQNETYIITVTNQGNEADTNLIVTCMIEDTQSYVSSEGVTPATQTGKMVKFATLPSLAPKTKAVWKVVTRAEKADDVRFKVTLTSDQLRRPVEKTESTNQY